MVVSLRFRLTKCGISGLTCASVFRTRFCLTIPIFYSNTRPLSAPADASSFQPLHSTNARRERHTATRDAPDIHDYARKQAATQTCPNLPPLSTEAVGSCKSDGVQLFERGSRFKMLLCASLCACSVLGTNPAQLRLHNSFLSRSKHKITNVPLVSCMICKDSHDPRISNNVRLINFKNRSRNMSSK